MSVAWDTPLASPRWSWQFGQLDLRRSHVRSCRSRSSSATAESIAAAGTTIKLTLCKPLKDGELGTEMRQQCQRVVRSIVTLSYTWVGPLSRCHRTIGALIRGPSTLANRLEGRVGRLWESRSSTLNAICQLPHAVVAPVALRMPILRASYTALTVMRRRSPADTTSRTRRTGRGVQWASQRRSGMSSTTIWPVTRAGSARGAFSHPGSHLSSAASAWSATPPISQSLADGRQGVGSTSSAADGPRLQSADAPDDADAT